MLTTLLSRSGVTSLNPRCPCLVSKHWCNSSGFHLIFVSGVECFWVFCFFLLWVFLFVCFFRNLDLSCLIQSMGRWIIVYLWVLGGSSGLIWLKDVCFCGRQRCCVFPFTPSAACCGSQCTAQLPTTVTCGRVFLYVATCFPCSSKSCLSSCLGISCLPRVYIHDDFHLFPVCPCPWFVLVLKPSSFFFPLWSIVCLWVWLHPWFLVYGLVSCHTLFANHLTSACFLILLHILDLSASAKTKKFTLQVSPSLTPDRIVCLCTEAASK